MTIDSGLEPVAARTKPPVRRRPTPPPPNDDGDVTDVADLARQNRVLLERLERLEASQGKVRYVESEPANPIGQQRIADDEELTPFVVAIREQTRPTPSGFQRESVAYNYPLRLFAKPDGTIVSLQGDPQNRAYYQDKGYVLLDAEQTRRWYAEERQKVVALQQEKARVINTLRQVIALDPTLQVGISTEHQMAWDHMTVAELEHDLAVLMGTPDQHGQTRKVLTLPKRFADAETKRADAEAKKLLAGVETSPPATRVREFEEQQEQLTQGRRGGRTVEVTPRNAAQFR